MTNIWGCCHLRIKCLPANLLAALMWRWCLNSERAAFQLRMEDSRERQGDDEKGRWMPGSHVDDQKGKKAMVYKARKDRRKRGGPRKKGKIRSLGHVRRGFIATFHARILKLFTLKPNILAQDQTSFLSCTL